MLQCQEPELIITNGLGGCLFFPINLLNSLLSVFAKKGCPIKVQLFKPLRNFYTMFYQFVDLIAYDTLLNSK